MVARAEEEVMSLSEVLGCWAELVCVKRIRKSELVARRNMQNRRGV